MDDASESLRWYLVNTNTIRNVRERFNLLEGGDSWLLPWSVKSICLNSNVSREFLQDFVLRNQGFNFENVEIDGAKFEVLKGPDMKMDHRVVPPQPLMSVKNLMNLAIFLYARDQGETLPSPVKLEDALFFLKNNVMIPDDFMPHHLMGNVEGTMDLTIESLRREFQFLPGITAIFLYPEIPDARYSRVKYVFASPCLELGEEIGLERVLEILKKSFAELNQDPRYIDFESSRLLKTLIYNIEVKKSRELKRPFFTPDKVARLAAMGVPVTETSVSEKVSVASIKTLRENKLISAKSLSDDWLRTQISTV